MGGSYLYSAVIASIAFYTKIIYATFPPEDMLDIIPRDYQLETRGQFPLVSVQENRWLCNTHNGHRSEPTENLKTYPSIRGGTGSGQSEKYRDASYVDNFRRSWHG